MKKLFSVVLIIIILSVFIYILNETKNVHKVFKIKSPIEIFIDTNNNLIFDEKEPFVLVNVHYIEPDTNTSDFGFNLTSEQKFLISYLEKQLSYNLLKEKFVTIKDNHLYVENESYENKLLNSNLFFNDTPESKNKFINYVKSINPDDYLIINPRSKKYHKLSCETGKQSKSMLIIKKDKLIDNFTPCRYCHIKPSYYLFENKSKFKNKKPDKIYSVKNSYIKNKIKIYFLNPYLIKKPYDKCNTEACLALKHEIDNAKNSIDFALYGMEKQSAIFNALKNAKNRGVKIRWVTDYDKKNINYYEDSIKLQKILTDCMTDEIYEKTYKQSIMHNKFFIFDKQKVYTGSTNITSTGLTGFNANYSVLIDSEELAQIYTQEFNQMYQGKFHTLKTKFNKNKIKLDDNLIIESYFSPQDKIITNKVIPLILNAKKYIYIPIFYITNYDLIEPLKIAKSKGVEIKIINDATNAHNKYSIHKILRKEGIEVKTENYAGKMHMKSIIIDDKISLIGSMNLTKSAQNINDENVLIIYNKEIAQYLKQTFLYMWNNIPSKYLYIDPRAESFESIGSCFDGIDNDFDEKIDKEDEGCFTK